MTRMAIEFETKLKPVSFIEEINVIDEITLLLAWMQIAFLNGSVRECLELAATSISLPMFRLKIF